MNEDVEMETLTSPHNEKYLLVRYVVLGEKRLIEVVVMAADEEFERAADSEKYWTANQVSPAVEMYRTRKQGSYYQHGEGYDYLGVARTAMRLSNLNSKMMEVRFTTTMFDLRRAECLAILKSVNDMYLKEVF